MFPHGMCIAIWINTELHRHTIGEIILAAFEMQNSFNGLTENMPKLRVDWTIRNGIYVAHDREPVEYM